MWHVDFLGLNIVKLELSNTYLLLVIHDEFSHATLITFTFTTYGVIDILLLPIYYKLMISAAH